MARGATGWLVRDKTHGRSGLAKKAALIGAAEIHVAT